MIEFPIRLEYKQPSDRVLCFPYRPLYASLAERDYAVRELNMNSYDNVQIPQQQRMIRDLESVPYAVLGNDRVESEFSLRYHKVVSEYFRTHL